MFLSTCQVLCSPTELLLDCLLSVSVLFVSEVVSNMAASGPASAQHPSTMTVRSPFSHNVLTVFELRIQKINMMAFCLFILQHTKMVSVTSVHPSIHRCFMPFQLTEGLPQLLQILWKTQGASFKFYVSSTGQTHTTIADSEKKKKSCMSLKNQQQPMKKQDFFFFYMKPQNLWFSWLFLNVKNFKLLWKQGRFWNQFAP